MAGGTANFIIYFDYYVIVTAVIATMSDVFEAHFIHFVIMVHDVIKPCGVIGWPGPGVKGCYLSLISGIFTNTPSHICGSWYLPIFLFRNGSLALISIDVFDGSGMTLVLPANYAEILQRKVLTSGVVSGHGWVRRALIYSLNLSENMQ